MKYIVCVVELFYRLISRLIQVLGFQNVIVFEMEQCTRENALAVFKEILRRGWDKRYRIVLVSREPERISHWKSKRVAVIRKYKYGDKRYTMWPVRWYSLQACLIIDENLQIKKRSPLTKSVYLSHGSPVKDTHEYYNCLPDTDYALCQSEFWKPIESYGLNISEDKFVIKGLPRNDALFESVISLREVFDSAFAKIVVWYPTFRQREDRYCIQNTESAAIPIIHDEAAARQINEIAAQYGVMLVVKPHPVQDISRIQALNLDHLKVITDEFFARHGITSYEFLGKTDALITDYSSVIFDYLLTGKPIALAQEDYEEYEKKVGFAIDMNLLRSCTVQLESAEDFESFFRDLVEGNDPLREKRDELMHLTNQYTDGHSTERVVDWLETLLKN